MSGIRFIKGHGTENDFVVLPDPERSLDLTPALISALCDRRAGVGGDGVLRVVLASADPEGAPMSPESRWFMDYRNADGSVAEMCGNGIRVVARYLVDAGLEPPGTLRLATRGGVKTVRLDETGDVTVDMGPPGFPSPAEVKVRVDDRGWSGAVVDMGNPHVVAFVDDLADVGRLLDAPQLDPQLPHGANVEFVVGRGERHIAMRVHERGVGETRSCGTGACAAMVAAARRDQVAAPSSYVVDVPGGRLTVAQRDDGHVELTGPAVLVAEGELTLDWITAHR